MHSSSVPWPLFFRPWASNRKNTTQEAVQGQLDGPASQKAKRKRYASFLCYGHITRLAKGSLSLLTYLGPRRSRN